MNKKLNNFNPKSTHYIVDSRGQLKFLSLCPALNQQTAEEVLINHAKKICNDYGVVKAFEHFKYKY